MKDPDATIRMTEEQIQELRKSSYDFGYASYKKAWEDQLGKARSELQQENENLKYENARLREALEFYAKGDNAKTFSGEERYLQLVADEMDISKIDEQWKTGKRAREALKGGE